MAYKIIFFLLFLTLTFSCKTETEKNIDIKTEKQAIIDSTIAQFQKELLRIQLDSVFAKTEFNGVVSVSQDGKMMYEKFNGFQDFKEETPLSHNSVFAIASVSKQFTAVAILLLEEQGKLSTDDKVSGYLKSFEAKPFQNITIKELLNHTSGISDYGSGLLSEPGKEFHYSNKGFRLLGEIIEKVSGKSYDQNITELFKNTGMQKSSTATLFEGENLAGAFTGTPKSHHKTENMPLRLASESIGVPAGGILSTVTDLHRWNYALYTGEVLKPATLKKFTEKSADRNHQILGKMGYGLGIMMNVGKPEAYFHTGYVKGSPSLLIYYPKTKTSVVILSNIADESKGKSAVFVPHRKTKEVTDILQTAVSGLLPDLTRPSSAN